MSMCTVLCGIIITLQFPVLVWFSGWSAPSVFQWNIPARARRCEAQDWEGGTTWRPSRSVYNWNNLIYHIIFNLLAFGSVRHRGFVVIWVSACVQGLWMSVWKASAWFVFHTVYRGTYLFIDGVSISFVPLDYWLWFFPTKKCIFFIGSCLECRNGRVWFIFSRTVTRWAACTETARALHSWAPLCGSAGNLFMTEEQSNMHHLPPFRPRRFIISQ